MKNRRQLLRYAGLGLLSYAATSALPQLARAQNSGLSVQSLGHTCFLFSGSGIRVLVNPFRTLGCTAGYRLPRPSADIVLISSQLFDEGAAENLPGAPPILFEPGPQFQALKGIEFEFQGIGIAHDRQGGRRFGTNVAWSWTQGGIRILHLGGAAAPIEIEQQILMGRPDVMFVPVGGGPKAYNPQEALAAIQTLRPRIAVPTHYRTQAADPTACDIVPLEDFLAINPYPVSTLGSTLSLSPGGLPPEGQTAVRVMNYAF
ncbi:MAG: MBL fold metallo-hydrolase [Spirulinaceae cyanobacterium RM2_2_10]|nr:MBL fold metallo-hydrolase [Spirulinaceae cyanobacterium SM2_1_0]NJO20645.1 MBL fold metallo-hydrolase [Spirulinaceae cyanobacterium RM2_2_10]